MCSSLSKWDQSGTNQNNGTKCYSFVCLKRTPFCEIRWYFYGCALRGLQNYILVTIKLCRLDNYESEYQCEDSTDA